MYYLYLESQQILGYNNFFFKTHDEISVDKSTIGEYILK